MAKDEVDLPPEVAEFFRKTGSKGGKVAASKMTSKQRSERAKNAVAAREAKRAAAKTPIKTVKTTKAAAKTTKKNVKPSK